MKGDDIIGDILTWKKSVLIIIRWTVTGLFIYFLFQFTGIFWMALFIFWMT